MVEEKGLRLSITEGGKEGKSKATTSCKYPEERFQECSKQRRSCFGNECGNAGSGLENEDQAAGSEGEGEKTDV